jgi:hypothetical protein
MTTVFDDRERAFEKRFAMEEELRFKATARRNKLLGLWAAEKMGISGSEADEYAKSVVKADFEAPGDEDVVGKVLADFRAKNVDQTEQQVRSAMNELAAVALSQIEKETGKATV